MDLDVRVWEEDDAFELAATFNGYRYDLMNAMLASIRSVALHFADQPDTTVAACDAVICHPATPVSSSDSGDGQPPATAAHHHHHH